MSPKKKDGTNVDDERATSFCSLEKAEDRSTFHRLGKKNLLECLFSWRITNFEAKNQLQQIKPKKTVRKRGFGKGANAM
jgi:hypothetical protein